MFRTPRDEGFTLIELMIVVTIVGILGAIAVPAYQDYSIRAQVSEGLSLASAVQDSVAEYYEQFGDWPADNLEAGVSRDADIRGNYTHGVRIRDNVIEIHYSNDAHNALHGTVLELQGTHNEGSISWLCTSNGDIEANHLPPACR